MHCNALIRVQRRKQPTHEKVMKRSKLCSDHVCYARSRVTILPPLHESYDELLRLSAIIVIARYATITSLILAVRSVRPAFRITFE